MQETIKSREGNKMKRYLVGIYAFVGAIVLTGCVAGGAAFVKDEAVPEDKGLIYIYRPNNFQGSAVDITIKDNGQTVFKIKNGQYVKHFVEPGKHKLHTDTMAIDKPVELDVEGGKTYYLKTSLNVGLWTGTWSLNRVYEEEALLELSCCKSGSK